jgi:hypothetical protein
MTANTPPLSNIAPTGGLSHANKNRMSEYDIVAGDIKKYKLKMDPKKAYAALLKMTQQPNYRVLRHNDSLLFIDNHKDGTAEGIMFSADKPQAFVQSLKYFNNGLKKAGIHQLEISSVNKDVEPFLKKAHLNYKIAPSENGVHITVTE